MGVLLESLLMQGRLVAAIGYGAHWSIASVGVRLIPSGALAIPYMQNGFSALSDVELINENSSALAPRRLTTKRCNRDAYVSRATVKSTRPVSEIKLGGDSGRRPM